MNNKIQFYSVRGSRKVTRRSNIRFNYGNIGVHWLCIKYVNASASIMAVKCINISLCQSFKGCITSLLGFFHNLRNRESPT